MSSSTSNNSTHVGNNAPIPIPKTVKSRRGTTRHLPLIAVGTYSDTFLAESGETGTLAELTESLPNLPPTLFTAVGSADFVAHLTSVYIFRTPNTWQWRATPHERNMGAPGGTMRAVRVNTAIHFFGWKRADNSGYHRIIDPVTMYGRSIDDVFPGEVSAIQDPHWQQLAKLLQWGITIRDFCHENGLEIRPTLGSISAQFLTDRRFYPHARRKVPATINGRTRERLPGNHYVLNVVPDPSNNFSAHYLDQHRAHHYHARNTALPDSDHCHAYGNFIGLADISFDDVDSTFIGLYCLDLCAPKVRPPFDWLRNADLSRAFVYSNEVQHVLDMGYTINGVRAAWGSRKRDQGIARYACWSEEQLDKYDGAPWLKPLLLATYGVLAARPVSGQSVYRLAQKGTPIRLKTGRRELNGLHLQAPRKLEPKVAYVLQRGMIEAATRSESIGLAQWLSNLDYRILSIYADAVIVEADDDKPLPQFIPDPWRHKRELSHLQFINQQAFTSDGMTKLPGVARELNGYRQHTMPGYAPRRVQHEALTGRKIQTNRRI